MKTRTVKDDRNNRQGAQAGRLNDIKKIGQSGIAPHAAIEIEPVEENQFNGDDNWEDPPEGGLKIGRNIEIKTNQMGAVK